MLCAALPGINILQTCFCVARISTFHRCLSIAKKIITTACFNFLYLDYCFQQNAIFVLSACSNFVRPAFCFLPIAKLSVYSTVAYKLFLWNSHVFCSILLYQYDLYRNIRLLGIKDFPHVLLVVIAFIQG